MPSLEPVEGNPFAPRLEPVEGNPFENAPAFQPPPNWQFSASRKQYRDPDGKLYDLSGAEIISIPDGMSPADAMKQYKSGTRVRLPDGRMGTVP